MRTAVCCPRLEELALLPERAGWPWTEESPQLPDVRPDGRSWPRVSIVTPSYNQGQFIEATIRSVLLQGYPNLEYIIIDGGSTDESVDIIRKYEPHLAYWSSGSDGGQSDAINKGWKLSRGEILAYLNSDDLYTPGGIWRAAKYFLENPQAGVVYGACRLIDGFGTLIRDNDAPDDWSLSTFFYSLPQPTMLIRREVLEAVGFLDTTLHYAMDLDLCIRIALAGANFAKIPGGPIAVMRIWEGAKSSIGHEAFISEEHRILDRLASNPALERIIRRRVPYLKAWVYLWPAYECFKKGNLKTSRRYLLYALRHSYRILGSSQYLGLVLRAFLGIRGNFLARRIK